MRNTRICFIGGGNMASSLVGGLLADGYPADRLIVAEPEAGQRERLRSSFGIRVSQDNAQAAADADVVVLAVKPQRMAGAAAAIGPLSPAPLFLTVAAGVRIGDLRRWLGTDGAIVRGMPNTPALLGAGVTALFAGGDVDPADRELAEGILRAVGAVVWIDDEALMDAVTALSGSGPAYFFLLMEIMAATGVEMGLSTESARLLTQETAIGAARMALEADVEVAELRRRVTSPGGTTEAAMQSMHDSDLTAVVRRAILSARDRSRTLADEVGTG
ncbi:MAG: pyrroline-5-carboxylate reductase [Gammaproteobacteria bacterium]|jgi:pyrroline-5-carboxylate reductase